LTATEDDERVRNGDKLVELAEEAFETLLPLYRISF